MHVDVAGTEVSSSFRPGRKRGLGGRGTRSGSRHRDTTTNYYYYYYYHYYYYYRPSPPPCVVC